MEDCPGVHRSSQKRAGFLCLDSIKGFSKFVLKDLILFSICGNYCYHANKFNTLINFHLNNFHLQLSFAYEAVVNFPYFALTWTDYQQSAKMLQDTPAK